MLRDIFFLLCNCSRALGHRLIQIGTASSEKMRNDRFHNKCSELSHRLHFPWHRQIQMNFHECKMEISDNNSFVDYFKEMCTVPRKLPLKTCHKRCYTNPMKFPEILGNPNVSYLLFFLYKKPRLLPFPTPMPTFFWALHKV